MADLNNTVFEGAIPNAQVGDVLAKTDVLAVPSLWYENSPVVIQEARAVGVPVIASRLGALTEKVSDGVDGVLVTPGDVDSWREALMRLATSPAAFACLKETHCFPMSLTEHVAHLLEIYAGILNQVSVRRSG
ncbi:MAG: D-inositol 3-phosphate glycosyltransferase [Chloroflexi bacterium ADurb.Bin360]|nr:MAG: D-inositol 3-phosphate glycosyltransferase [Chloroflexi bacterium ADurb.Bin360]